MQRFDPAAVRFVMQCTITPQNPRPSIDVMKTRLKLYRGLIESGFANALFRLVVFVPKAADSVCV